MPLPKKFRNCKGRDNRLSDPPGPGKVGEPGTVCIGSDGSDTGFQKFARSVIRDFDKISSNTPPSPPPEFLRESILIEGLILPELDLPFVLVFVSVNGDGISIGDGRAPIAALLSGSISTNFTSFVQN
jgi:hypothetical protein